MFMVMLSAGSAFGQTPVTAPASLLLAQTIGTRPGFIEEAQLDGSLFVGGGQQLGPRSGDDELWSANSFRLRWWRGGARAAWMVRANLSAERSINGSDGYASLFQSELHDGQHLVDRKFPRRYLGEIGVAAATRLGDRTLLSAYVAPVGVPAFGIDPTTSRPSAAFLPRAELASSRFSLLDHASSVVTVGGSFGIVSVEASAFHDARTGGGDFAPKIGSIDSNAARIRIGGAEGMFGEVSRASLSDADRAAAAVGYRRSLASGEIAVEAAAVKEERDSGLEAPTSVLGELLWRRSGNAFSFRVEASDQEQLLAADNALSRETMQRIGAYSIGYAREFSLRSAGTLALGGMLTYFHAPREFEAVYGHKPQSSYFFVRYAPRI